MYIPVNKSMLMHMRDCTSELSKNEQQSWRGEVCLAELLPEDEMLWAFRLEHDRIQIPHVVVWLLDVEYVWVGRQIGDLLSHLVGIILLVIVQT